MQSQFSDEFFQRRTMSDYREDISNLKHRMSQSKDHVIGLTVDSALNDIDGYQVVDNWSLDSGHHTHCTRGNSAIRTWLHIV